MKSAENVSDAFTRQTPGQEATLSQHVFNTLWKKWGPFNWDLMASGATVRRDPQGKKRSFFSRYFEETASGVDLFAQNLAFVEKTYCFPPIPMIGMVLKLLQQQKKDCIMILPAINAPWVNLASAHIIDLIQISEPFQTNQFTVLNNSGKRIPKKYPHAMIAVKLGIEKIMLKNNLLITNFISDHNSKFYRSAIFVSIMNHVNKKQSRMNMKQKATKLSLTVSEVRSVKSAINILNEIIADYNKSD